MIDLEIPRVLSDVLDVVSQRRVRVQDARYQALCILRQERWQFVFSFDDFLVEFLRVLVFKRQVTADHRIQDDA